MNSRFAPPSRASAPSPPVDGDLVDLRRLLAIARRQFRLAALCTLAGTVLGLAYLGAATPLYTSTATVFINPLAAAPAAGALAPVVAVSLFDSETGILGSEKIAADAFNAIDPAWLAIPPSPAARLKRLLRPGLQSPEAQRQLLLDSMRARLLISRPDAAFLLELAYTSPSRQYAAAILAAFIDAYRADRAARREAAAADELASLEARIGDLRLRLADAARAAAALAPDEAGMAALAGYRGQAETFATAVSQLLMRQQEVLRLSGAPDDAVRLVSPPRVPVFDSSPNAARALLLSTLAGAMAGVGIGLLREASERGFRSAGQVRRELGVPCLALLPVQTAGLRDAGVGERVESLRAVKLAIDQAVAASRPRCIGFVPVAAGDGASTTARSFATLLAAGGSAPLLVDADMRREVEADAGPGFSDALKGEAPVPAIDPASGLAFLPAGTDRQRAAAAIALDAPEVAETLARVSVPFDVVVVDLPPLARFVDARAMTRHLDALVIVARWRRTERRRLRALVAADRELARRLVGVILNRAAPASADRYDDDPLPDERG